MSFIDVFGGPVLTKGEARVRSHFEKLGIMPSEVRLRENVLTFKGWIEKGRVVKKGSHGCRLTVFKEKLVRHQDGTEKAEKRPWHYFVFHVSQTTERTEGA
jgi:hypothetical protein